MRTQDKTLRMTREMRLSEALRNLHEAFTKENRYILKLVTDKNVLKQEHWN
jgi:hypothetical protein